MNQKQNNQNEKKSYHDVPQHKVSVVQWIIILTLSMGMLFGFYVGCGSNRVGVTMELPEDAPAQTAPAPSQNE